MTRRSQTLLALVVLVPTVLLMLVLLPRGALGTDVSRIGQGKPALVLVFENHQPLSMDTIALLKPIQRRHGEQLLLLAADTGAPPGQQLMRQYSAFAGEVLSFSADGQLIARGLIADAAGLERRLNADFGLRGGR